MAPPSQPWLPACLTVIPTLAMDRLALSAGTHLNFIWTFGMCFVAIVRLLQSELLPPETLIPGRDSRTEGGAGQQYRQTARQQ